MLGPGSVPKDLGRTQRVVSPAQRRALDARDRSCVFAGCQAPNWWGEAHHIPEWIFDGPADLDRRDGRWRTWRPDGTEISVPAPLLAAS